MEPESGVELVGDMVLREKMSSFKFWEATPRERRI